ncbi:hypothetical protein [Sphingobium cupriresistens]|uniref:Sulfotransferase family protein n=1 Tax=Sphingobium cupriresistens TaxID=1132417 RepID=A0A8G1ZJ13_9SPHN|nr:hypothetical protein [Sphingobium cupriresistens]RYM14518.1 hypothetical protein EWH12_01840 [Sphingobium cupriresistens]
MTASLPSTRDIMANAEWLAHRYDPGHDAVHLRHVRRARHAETPFLTDQHLGEDDAPLVLRRVDAMLDAPAPAPIHFLFHSAYCCSTLLAAAFDYPGVAMGLKEPVLLNDLIGWRHRGAKGPDVARVLDEGLRLLARPFAPGEAVVVKPSNIVNPLIPALLGLRPQARALLLHAPLDAYLASIARKGMWGRLWVRDLFGKLLREGMLAPLGIAPDDYLGLTDIQVAAAGWLAQQRQFQDIAMKLGDRVATLDSETLVARPGDSLAALARLFGLALDERAIATIVNGPIFARNAKDGADFAPGHRAQEAQRGLELHGEEVEKVAHWARVLADNGGIAMALPNPLLA